MHVGMGVEDGIASIPSHLHESCEREREKAGVDGTFSQGNKGISSFAGVGTLKGGVNEVKHVRHSRSEEHTSELQSR